VEARNGNPAHEDLAEACRMIGPDFILNVVLSSDGSLIRVLAGHWEEAHREGCRTVDQMLRVEVDEPFDLTIASAGGFPLDIDLRQAHKGLENACLTLRPGGAIVFFAECPNGAGIQSFEEYVSRYNDEIEMKAALDNEFIVGGHKAYWIMRLGRKYDVHLVSTLAPGFVERCHFKHVPVDHHQTVVSDLLERADRDARIAVIPHSGFTLPALRAAGERISK
jgi:lactate racemase